MSADFLSLFSSPPRSFDMMKIHIGKFFDYNSSQQGICFLSDSSDNNT